MTADPDRTLAGLPPLPAVDGGFATILADPPWRLRPADAEQHPASVTPHALAGLAIGDVAARNAHLYLWVPNALLPDGLRVMRAWGFRYVTNLVWAKRRRDGGPDGRGMGFYFRSVTELALFGVRGTLRTLGPARRQVNLIEAARREFGRKPDEQYAVIEACSPGPYLELFARFPRPGWMAWAGDYARDAFPHRGDGGQLELPGLPPVRMPVAGGVPDRAGRPAGEANRETNRCRCRAAGPGLV